MADHFHNQGPRAKYMLYPYYCILWGSLAGNQPARPLPQNKQLAKLITRTRKYVHDGPTCTGMNA